MSAEDLPAADYALITAALQGFGLSEPIEARSVAEGLMNRNWRVCTREGVWALKQILDVHANQARRQHRVTRTLAGLGLPVPPPQTTPDGDTLVNVEGVEVESIGMFAVLPWVDGVHRDGRDLALAECRHLGKLLARIHCGLGGDELVRMLGPAPESQVVAVTEAVKAKAKIDYYLGLVHARAERDEFDDVVRQRLTERQDLLERLAYLRLVAAPMGF